MIKVAIIFGTRPEAIKLFPVYDSLKKIGLNVDLVSTGQHKEMLVSLFDFFSVKPDVELETMKKGQSLVELSSRVLRAVEEYLIKKSPDIVVVQGDTTTCFMASLAAFYQKIPVAHVEAGLRTYKKYSPFPEEINRKMVGCLADLHFAPTERALEALKEEQIIKSVYNVGNTVVDAVLMAKSIVEKRESDYTSYFKNLDFNKKIVLITSHRRENLGEGLINICNAVREIANKYPFIQFVYPVHYNPNVREVVNEKLASIENVFLIEPLEYDKMVFLMSRSYIILTDSGGIQEEAPTFGIPLIVLREDTERPEGVDRGCAMLVGTQKERIIQVFDEIARDASVYEKMAGVSNPYGDGNSSERIANTILDYVKGKNN